MTKIIRFTQTIASARLANVPHENRFWGSIEYRFDWAIRLRITTQCDIPLRASFLEGRNLYAVGIIGARSPDLFPVSFRFHRRGGA